MTEFVNQTELGVDKNYPGRFALTDVYAHWDTAAPHYEPYMPTKPDFETMQERLAEAGLHIASAEDLTEMARMDTDDAVYNFGEQAGKLRHPLGRTGVNGSGIFYKAGASHTADVVAARLHPDHGYQVALVHVRGKWATPGGFMDPEDHGDPRAAGVRELWEETQLDVRDWDIDDPSLFVQLVPEEIKPRSRKSADLGWLVNSVTGVILPDWTQGETLAVGTEDPSEDIKNVGWFSRRAIAELIDGNIGEDHERYIQSFFDRLRSDD